MTPNQMGRFLLSISDTGEIRESFGNFRFEHAMTTYAIQGADNPKRVQELLITNASAGLFA